MTASWVARRLARPCVAGALVFVSFASSSAPVLGGEESATPARPPEQAPPSAYLGVAPASSLRTLDRSLNPETSIGNKNFDLLLELKLGPGEGVRPAAPRLSAAAASAAAAELKLLRAKAAQRPATRQDDEPADEAITRPRLPLQSFEGLGTLHGDVRAGESEPVLRREWSGQFNGGGRGDAAYGGSGGAASAGQDVDNPLRRILHEVRQFLLEHGVTLLGAAGVIAVLGAALKAFSRRP